MRVLRRSCVVAAVLGFCLVAAAACVTQTVTRSSMVTAGAAMEPGLVVERFLRAANANDLNTMGQLFGTRNGSVFREEPRSYVEQWMFTLASVLRHDDFTMQGTQIVPGRSGEAVRVIVDMRINDRNVAVPFVVVNSRDGWIVEQVDVEVITNRP